jgi:hypothetical protein
MSTEGSSKPRHPGKVKACTTVEALRFSAAYRIENGSGL